MRHIRRILVAIKDPAGKRSAAVTKAAQLARALNAQLWIFQAISAPVYVDTERAFASEGILDVERRIRDECLKQLEAIARPLRHKGIRVSTSVRWDQPIYEAILREAHRVGANLIVAEQHAGRHVAAGLLHLTDWELLRHSPVPLLLVKQGGAYRRPAILAAVDPDHSYGKPADLDRDILQAGAALASVLKGKLHAMHAYIPVPVIAVANGAPSDVVARLRIASAAAAAKKLARTVQGIGIQESCLHLVGRHPTDAIEEVANRIHSSLVVMGAISRSGLKRLLIGNTAENVLGNLKCDILVVKPARFVKRVPRSRRGPRPQSFPSLIVMH